MKIRHISIAIILLLVVPVFFSEDYAPKQVSAQTKQQDLYFGVDVAYENVTETKQIIDRISSYTNLFVLGCSGDHNSTRLTELSDHLFNKNMSFIVYTDDPRYPNQQWYNTSKPKYGEKFLGLYLFDEAGGHQLDGVEKGYYMNVWNASDYSDARDKFESNINYGLNMFSRRAGDVPTFTSDYALYWYDFEGGYDTVFAEYGWNYSRQINTALCRGAAAVQNKDWGVMITWTYTQAPYIESGPELYNDMVLAYQSGAKYIIVFDSNEGWTSTILKDEHYNAMQQFWQYVENNPRNTFTKADRIAYVLPDYYAYGFRGPNDKVWGIWESNSEINLQTPTYDLSMAVGYVLMLYMDKIDLVYENGQSATSYGYKGLIYWNDPRLFQPEDQFPRVSPNPTPTLAPSPSPTPTQAPIPTPTGTPTPIPTQTTSPTITSSPNSNKNFWLPTPYLYALTAGIALVGLAGSVLWISQSRKKRKL